MNTSEPRRRHDYIRDYVLHGAKLAVGIALAVLVVVAILLSSGCGTGSGETSSQQEQPLSVRVAVSTPDGSIAQNIDYQSCQWKKPQYVLRNANGKIIASGSAGEQGSVTSQRPDYLCTLDTFTIPKVPPADFYELEVTAVADWLFGGGDEVSETVTFSREEAAREVTVEFTG